MDIPTTKYAKSGSLHIAYQTIGEGPHDLLFVPGWVSSVELIWQEPRLAAFLRRLAGLGRLIVYDKRGTGSSDPVPVDQPPTLEQRMKDMHAVLDAVGVDRTVIIAFSEGGAASALFAATYPARTNCLILWGGAPRITWADDWPWGVTRDQGMQELRALESGSPDRFFGLDRFAPSAAAEPDLQDWWHSFSRVAASPAMYVALMKTNGATDVRGVLPSIQVPTLILHREGDLVFPIEGARFMAEHIPNSQLVELPGDDHWPWIGDSEAVLAEIQQFLTGTRPPPQADRFLTTVMFTDIVASTRMAEKMGDTAWKQLLDKHDRISRHHLRRYGGTWVKGTGDGMLATFDGPARAVQAALAIEASARVNGFRLRAGIHTGEAERRGDDVAGMAVHIASRVADLAGPDEVLVTNTVRDLVAGSGLQFEDHGTHTLKGIPNAWHLMRVV